LPQSQLTVQAAIRSEREKERERDVAGVIPQVSRVDIGKSGGCMGYVGSPSIHLSY
jgi:hypothetical protein